MYFFFAEEEEEEQFVRNHAFTIFSQDYPKGFKTSVRGQSWFNSLGELQDFIDLKFHVRTWKGVANIGSFGYMVAGSGRGAARTMALVDDATLLRYQREQSDGEHEMWWYADLRQNIGGGGSSSKSAAAAAAAPKPLAASSAVSRVSALNRGQLHHDPVVVCMFFIVCLSVFLFFGTGR